MPRPRKYQRDHLLDAALDLFWQQGYAATSVEALGQKMDLHPGSLYGAFVDKHSLFLAVLDRYVETAGRMPIHVLESAADKLAGIRQVFAMIIQGAMTPAGSCGCLMTNTAIELARADDAIAAKIAIYQQQVEDAFYVALQVAQLQGSLGHQSPAELRSLARFLNSSLQGIRVLARTTKDVAALQDIARLTLTLLR